MEQELDPRKGLPSASSIHRLISCPGSFKLERTMPAEEESDAASKGTRIHKALELGDFSILESDDEVSIAEACKEIFESTLFSLAGSADVKYIKEKRYFAKCGLYSGQLDAAAVWEAEGKHMAFLADYKTGRVEVQTPETNAQLQTLASLLYENTEEWHDGKPVEIYACIIQPLVSHSPVLLKLDEEDCKDIAEENEHYVSSALGNGDGTYDDSDPSACMYCKAKSVCPKLRVAMYSITREESNPLLSLSKKDKEMAFKKAKVVESLCEEIIETLGNAAISAYLENRPLPFDGIKVVDGITRRSITDPSSALILVDEELLSRSGGAVVNLDKSRFVKIDMKQLKSYITENLSSSMSPKEAAKAEREIINKISDSGLIETKKNKPSVKIA